MHVSIIIPTYRSAPWISKLIEAVRQQTGPETEIILVDDSPADYSATENLKLSRPGLVYARHARNYGEQTALFTGLHLASGQIVVMMDDDFECPPECLPALIAATGEHKSVVYLQFKRRGQNILRRWGSLIFNRLFVRLLKRPAFYLSSFKSFSRDLRDDILLQKNPHYILERNLFHPDTDLHLLRAEAGTSIRGRSNYSLLGLAGYFFTAVWRRQPGLIAIKGANVAKDRLARLPLEQRRRFTFKE